MYTLDSLNRLSEIQCDQDIKSLSHAIFPGTHCPLFGVALTASYVQNMTVVVIGTSECTYYTKNFAYHRQKGRDSVYSLVLEDKEVVFTVLYGGDTHLQPGGINALSFYRDTAAVFKNRL